MNFSYSQEVDSVLLMQKSFFFEDLKNSKNYIAPLSSITSGFVKPSLPKIDKLKRRFIKVGNSLYLHFVSSGKLYKFVDIPGNQYLLRRIDSTDNYNYNCQSLFIVDSSEILDYGGYGFWKTNGTIRRFNFIDREWDSYSVNEEVIPPYSNDCSWYDPGNRKLYVPYQEILNEGIFQKDGRAEFDLNFKVLDFRKRQWESLGTLTQDAFSILASRGLSFPTDEGVVFINFGKAYWIDYKTNSIKLLINSEQGQTLLRISSSSLYYFNNNKVYYYDYVKNLYDSIAFDKKMFAPTKMSIWKKPKDNSFYYWGIALLLVPLIMFWVRKKRLGAVKYFSNSTSSSGDSITPFTETEIGLLELLLKKAEQKKRANVNDVNYVLGIKDKNPGMQKKVRSDVINAINEKYVLFTQQKISVIQSVRSESDKRFFEYILNSETINTVAGMIRP